MECSLGNQRCGKNLFRGVVAQSFACDFYIGTRTLKILVHTNTHTHTYTHTRIHAYTHTRIHAYTHTHTRTKYLAISWLCLCVPLWKSITQVWGTLQNYILCVSSKFASTERVYKGSFLHFCFFSSHLYHYIGTRQHRKRENSSFMVVVVVSVVVVPPFGQVLFDERRCNHIISLGDLLWWWLGCCFQAVIHLFACVAAILFRGIWPRFREIHYR